MCGEAFLVPLLCVVLGNFHCANYHRSAKRKLPNPRLSRLSEVYSATIPTRELKLKLERSLRCCFMATKVGKPSASLCPEGIVTCPQGTKGTSGPPRGGAG